MPKNDHARSPLDVNPTRVPNMPGAQEVAPGVFLVTGRLEAEARARAPRELN